MKYPYLLPIMFALLTGLFWGMYGPSIAVARAAEKNVFKPYVMIGVAYLVWGILGGLVGMWGTKASFSFTGPGITWGFIGGTLGALGALALTLAMYTFPGKPIPQLVMPIVFGTAVSVAALTEMITKRAETSPWLWVGMVGVVVSIVMVAVNTPHGGPGHGPAGAGHGGPGHPVPAAAAATGEPAPSAAQ